MFNPKGIVVGKISEIHNDEGGLLKYGVLQTSVNFEKLEDVAIIVASREAPPEPLPPPPQTPGTETNPQETAQKLLEAQQIQQQAQEQVLQAQQQQIIGTFTSEARARNQVIQGLSQEQQELIRSQEAIRDAANAQRNLAQSAQETAQDFQQVNGINAPVSEGATIFQSLIFTAGKAELP